MKIEKMLSIVRKELIEIFYSRQEVILIYIGLILPSIILPILILYAKDMLNFISINIEKDNIYVLQYFLERIYPWFFIFGGSSASISTIIDSISGEKERKTIERVLSTPVDELTLLLGKSIASWLYTYVPILISFITFLISSNIFARILFDGYNYILPSTKVLFILFILAPIVTLALTGIGIIVSIKSKTMREANNMGGFVSFIIFFPLIYGFVQNPDLTGLIIISLITGIICILIFLIACKLFKREELIRYV